MRHALAPSVPRQKKLLRAFGRDRSGSIAGMTGLVMPVLIGFVAFAADVSVWEGQKNSAQGVADFAAQSALSSATAGNTVTQSKNEALAVAAVNGFVNGSNGVTVAVNSPPSSGSYTSTAGAYEVIITQPQQLYFASLLGYAPTVTVRSVVNKGGQPACIISLSPTAASAITISGSASVTGCGVAANSTNSKALDMSGGACLTAPTLQLVGSYNNSSSCGLNVTKVTTHGSATADPYASLTIPSFSGCNQNNFNVGGITTTASPGVYCNGITVQGGGSLTLSAGTYIINSGNLTVGGTSTLTATAGVSIILTSTTNHYGTVQISGGSTFNQTAPSTGAMAGIAIYVDRNAPSSSDSISGASGLNINGAVYMPTQSLTYSGGSNSGNSCTQLVASTFTFSGPSSANKNCGSLPVAGLEGGSSGLVE